jgi:hypothetical protein
MICLATTSRAPLAYPGDANVLPDRLIVSQASSNAAAALVKTG